MVTTPREIAGKLGSSQLLREVVTDVSGTVMLQMHKVFTTSCSEN